MQDETTTTAPTLADMISALGERNGIAGAAHKALKAAGHTFSLRSVYNCIERNGESNATIAVALFDALDNEKKQRAELAARRAAATL